MKDFTDFSEDDYRELIDIFAESITGLKKKEQVFLQGKNAFLNMLEDVNDSFKELEILFIGFVKSLVNALDAKSQWTKGHSERVARYTENIAINMGFDDDEIKNLRLAGLLHDIGKIGTYDYLLDKPEKLSQAEFEVVKKHPVQGAKILGGIKQLKVVIPYIKYHHERIDGKGYPEGLRDNEIPRGAKILHVADSYDSMSTDRPYRPAPDIKYAISEFHKYKGIQFDPQVTDAFLKTLETS
jgi:putative nucleotidyltransferase with HDIG domain